MGRLELVTGGARSGKSAFAERRAADLAAWREAARVAYVATAVAIDAEMAGRIAHHRARRPSGWDSVEAPTDLGPAIARAAAGADVVLVDCMSVWAANRLVAIGDPGIADGAEAAVWWQAVGRLEDGLVRELDDGLDAASATGADLLVVTNEVGFGLVPPTPLGRAYRDLLGRLNQHVAGRADAVHLVVAGIALDLRRIQAAAPAEAPSLAQPREEEHARR